jgi:hypothetical protein
VIYVTSSFGDVPELIPAPPADPTIGTQTESEILPLLSKLIDERLEAHGLVLKQ